ncbi:MAG: hypothetical protein ACRDZY_04115 [Acidimicrobiales bacterium]
MTLQNDHSAPDLEDGKASFDTVYNGEDPREYFEELGQLEYQIPHHGQQVFAALLAARWLPGRTVSPPERPTVLDVCCSYGINAALLSCDITLAELEAYYLGDPAGGDGAPARDDRSFFAAHRRPDAPRMVGLDVADRAVAYGRRAGLLDAGWVENLELSPPSAALAAEMTRTDLVTVTGGVGYVTARTFGHLLGAVGERRPPWVAAFCLRRFSYHDIADVAAAHGMVTERLAGRTFPQRRFASEEEREFTIRHLDAACLDATGREADGYHHTDFYLSRPADEVAARPLPELLPALAATGVERV